MLRGAFNKGATYPKTMASREVGLKNFCRLDKLIRHRFKKEGICAEMDET